MCLQRPRTWMALLRDPDITVLLERWKLLAVYFLTDKLASPQDFCTSKVCRRRYRKNKERKKQQKKGRVTSWPSIVALTGSVCRWPSNLILADSGESLINDNKYPAWLPFVCVDSVFPVQSLQPPAAILGCIRAPFQQLISQRDWLLTLGSPPPLGVADSPICAFFIFETLDRFTSSGMEGI